MTATLDMLKAANDIVVKARKKHSNIPEVTIVMGASGAMRKGQKHGHFAHRAWRTRDGESFFGEVLLSGESLERGGKETLGTILHELAHAACADSGIDDTSNGGRYHNTKFKEMAESFGLVIEKNGTIGWSVTSVPIATVNAYDDEIKALDKAITQYRVPAGEIVTASKQKKYMMQCAGCQDPVQVTKKWFQANEFAIFCKPHEMYYEMYVEETG